MANSPKRMIAASTTIIILSVLRPADRGIRSQVSIACRKEKGRGKARFKEKLGCSAMAPALTAVTSRPWSITFRPILSGEYPDLRATIFEKPPVDKIAKYSVNKFGLADRINVLTGDMFHDSFPKGYDIHFVSNILHDWDLKEVKGILRNSFQSLNSGGMIMIHDAHINKAKTGPISVAEYSVLLMFLSEGKCYSLYEMKEALEETGFNNIEYKPTVLNRSIITAKK